MLAVIAQYTCIAMLSLVPRPHPPTRKNGLVNQVKFLELAHTLTTVNCTIAKSEVNHPHTLSTLPPLHPPSQPHTPSPLSPLSTHPVSHTHPLYSPPTFHPPSQSPTHTPHTLTPHPYTHTPTHTPPTLSLLSLQSWLTNLA